MEGNSNPISPRHSKTIQELAIEGQKNLEETIQADYQIHSIFDEWWALQPHFIVERDGEACIFLIWFPIFLYHKLPREKYIYHHAEERQPYQQPIHLHVSSTNKFTLLRP